MILEPDQWYLGYLQILKDCRRRRRRQNSDDDDATGSVLVLCNADADAMAAARVLGYMLRSDGIRYRLQPCGTVTTLTDIIATANDLPDLCAVVLCNVGAARNLTKLFDDERIRLHAHVKLYVLDGRRPVHLANIHAGDNVVVFWDVSQDDDEENGGIPSDGDDLSGNDSQSSEESESESDDSDDSDDNDDDEGEQEFQDDDDGEEEFDDQENIQPKSKKATQNDNDDDSNIGSGVPAKRHKTTNATTDADNGSVASSNTAASTNSKHAKLNETALTERSTPPLPPTQTPAELRADRRARVRAYYHGGTYYGSPAAYMAYSVATQLRFGQEADLLWLSCVGVTDAFLHGRIDVTGYSSLALALREACLKLFPDDLYQRANNTVYAEHLMSSGGVQQDNLTKIAFSDNGRVLSETDFRFFLLRHSSLFDAMVCSEFVSTRFQLSTRQGMHKLQELFAQMGFPLEQCQQPFAFMKPSLKRRLRDQISHHAEQFGLESFEFTSFFRVTGYSSLLSASDVSYAVTALLACERNVETTLSGQAREDEELQQAFNVAYDALNSNAAPGTSLNGVVGGDGNNGLSGLVNGMGLINGSSSTGMGAGIRLAMHLQRFIMATAHSLVERGALVCLSHFRYAYVACTSHGDQPGRREDVVPHRERDTDETSKSHIFAKPLALNRLAHYLMDMHRENGKWTGPKKRPLVLLAEKPRSETYLVVGYEVPDTAGGFVKNRFGKNFELAAQSMQGSFCFDSFDSNVVEVAAHDVQRFIEQLHYLLDSV